MRLGAHVSIAGGFDLALERGEALKCQAIQIFVKNNNQWAAFPMDDQVIKRYRAKLKGGDIHPVVAHTSYLINLATPDDVLWKKSVEALEIELERCDILRVPFLVLHPGSHKGAGEDFGIRRVANALNEIYGRKKVKCVTCLEHTAGQGDHIGYKFEHLAAIRRLVKKKNRVGVCLDTCHLFAAGYDFRTPEQYAALVESFDKIVGLKHVKCMHLNDSKTPLGSRVDRHEHVGKGKIGRNGFRHFLTDPRFAELPGLIETESDAEMKYDKMNLRTLRRLMADKG